MPELKAQHAPRLFITKFALHGGQQGYNTFTDGPACGNPTDACDEYLNGVGISTLCSWLGVKPDEWDTVREEWTSAFVAGWEEAYLDYHTIPYKAP